ncbi:cytochrome-c-type assembly domain-containing protein (plasmid) [Rhizobium etli bv. mimosae str. Mim1]|nr:cytochrome-c-type assembly domain-containing protein [Rhizobium etli bv. mimosae str. Mim1]
MELGQSLIVVKTCPASAGLFLTGIVPEPHWDNEINSLGRGRKPVSSNSRNAFLFDPLLDRAESMFRSAPECRAARPNTFDISQALFLASDAMMASSRRVVSFDVSRCSSQPFGPLVAWKRGDLLGALQRLYLVAALAFTAAVIVFYLEHGGPVLSVLGVAAGLFLILGAVADLWYRAGIGKVAGSIAWRCLSGLPRSAFGTALAHAGLGVGVLGIVAVTTFQAEHVIEMKPGETTDAGGYSLHFDGMQPATGPNYTEERGHFTIRRAGVTVADTWSAKRLYTARQMPTTEAGILTFGLSQLYVSLGDATKDGGLVSLSDRRLRVGAPRRKARTKPATPAMEPAE